MTLYEELKERGLIAQTTDEELISELINSGKACFYIGFDPTADSLHAGHFMTLSLMKRLQAGGNKPVALIGGATALIGDPSGKTDMRKMLTKEQVDIHVAGIKKQLERFIDFSDDKAILVNNADWLGNVNYIDMLREVGPYFNVNIMLRAECYKQRLVNGLSFLEFNYMVMQAFDFYTLYTKYGCNLEFGGDDQWSNMLAGTELIRKKLGKDASAMTIPLLTNSQGIKMGKTVSGALWLDENKTTPFEFFQYWRNVDDADVIKCLKMLTFVPLDEIKKMESWEGAVHGEEKAKKALEDAKSVFAGGNDNIPEVVLSEEDLEDGQIDILTLGVKLGLGKSKSEIRRTITQGGLYENREKLNTIERIYTKDDLKDGVVIQKGKKTFVKAVIK